MTLPFITGNYGINSSLNTSTASSGESPTTSNSSKLSVYNRLPGLSGVPGADKSSTLPPSSSPGYGSDPTTGSATLPPSAGPLSSRDFDSMIPDSIREKLGDRQKTGEGAVALRTSDTGATRNVSVDIAQPSTAVRTAGPTAATRPGVVTETINKTTFTETTVRLRQCLGKCAVLFSL